MKGWDIRGKGGIAAGIVLAVLAGIFLFFQSDDQGRDRPAIDTQSLKSLQSPPAFHVPAKPVGPVLLTISGGRENINRGSDTAFDLAMLEAFPQVTHRVVTPWTEGETDFTGPRLIDVLQYVGGATGDTITATALNDYQIEIPVQDARQYPVILALKQNGKELRIRDKGPVWVIYPWMDGYPELQAESYHSRSIWQLSKIGIQ